MSDELKPETADSQAQGAPADSADTGPAYMTREEFKAERDRMFADMRRVSEAQSKPKNGKAKESVEPEASPAMDVHALLRREREISEAFDEVGSLNREQKSLLRKLVDAEKPENPLEYIVSHAKQFNRQSGETPTATTKTAPTGQPVSNAGAPSAPPKFTEDTPLWQVDPASRQRLIQEKGLAWYRATVRRQMTGQKFRIR